ncbi:hypothetical protein A3K86_09695 [Photobacterium jeanii]|uniref:Negative regulator of flagellin synthesis n=1 Tax=Photobacterium jeanii TaxID=858640 RepID=A0A178KHA4_9GAMM|nr:flagellar biosynthesis anti-sigma factor FlgM [Photobacterium jeanii]OAN16709.1 hypothetical protein A3K86_09695 [Photobacterium jeanii]PST87438.1 flagellar biosynthesis anti-sigma factor FlgM [Photobacterium jeanii]
MIGKIQSAMSQPVTIDSRTSANKSAAATPAAKQVELSNDVRSLQNAKAELRNTSDVDMDKVAKMKQMLQSGQVNVDLDKLAGTMVDYYQGNQ